MYKKYVNIFFGSAPYINVWVTNFDKFDKNKLIKLNVHVRMSTGMHYYWRACARALAVCKISTLIFGSHKRCTSALFVWTKTWRAHARAGGRYAWLKIYIQKMQDASASGKFPLNNNIDIYIYYAYTGTRYTYLITYAMYIMHI